MQKTNRTLVFLVDGGWTVWQNWGECNIACGPVSISSQSQLFHKARPIYNRTIICLDLLKGLAFWNIRHKIDHLRMGRAFVSGIVRIRFRCTAEESVRESERKRVPVFPCLPVQVWDVLFIFYLFLSMTTSFNRGWSLYKFHQTIFRDKIM